MAAAAEEADDYALEHVQQQDNKIELYIKTLIAIAESRKDQLSEASWEGLINEFGQEEASRLQKKASKYYEQARQSASDEGASLDSVADMLRKDLRSLHHGGGGGGCCGGRATKDLSRSFSSSSSAAAYTDNSITNKLMDVQPHEERLEYGSNGAEIAADNMAAHTAIASAIEENLQEPVHIGPSA